MKRPLAVALVLALAAPLLLLGCGKDNPTKPEDDPAPPPVVYPFRSTPANALAYMVIAFSERDSVRTDSVYADDYEGSSIDMTDPSPATYTFTKSDEVRFVGALAQASDVMYVNMDLKSPETWTEVHYVSDPPDWVTIQVPNLQITVSNIFGDGYDVRVPSSGEIWVFEFTLRPTPDSSSPTDTTWTIVRWVESRSQN